MAGPTPDEIAASWDARYAAEGFAYGEAPSDFLREVIGRLPPGPVLCLADGEGRNGVYCAEHGHAVTAVDLSPVGLRKAQALAAKRGVTLVTEIADVTTFPLGEAAWAGIVSIWCHLPHPGRRALHARLLTALQPGGAFVLEAYTPRQLGRGTGGPPTAALLVEPDELRAELEGLRIERLEEKVRDVQEGTLHAGTSSVVQCLAFRP